MCICSVLQKLTKLKLVILTCPFIGDWKADGYHWYQNGWKQLPTSGPLVVKTYFVLMVEGRTGPEKTKDF